MKSVRKAAVVIAEELATLSKQKADAFDKLAWALGDDTGDDGSCELESIEKIGAEQLALSEALDRLRVGVGDAFPTED